MAKNRMEEVRLPVLSPIARCPTYQKSSANLRPATAATSHSDQAIARPPDHRRSTNERGLPLAQEQIAS